MSPMILRSMFFRRSILRAPRTTASVCGVAFRRHQRMQAPRNIGRSRHFWSQYLQGSPGIGVPEFQTVQSFPFCHWTSSEFWAWPMLELSDKFCHSHMAAVDVIQ
eukprot:s127_g14.t1